jgi:hypothetical protein
VFKYVADFTKGQLFHSATTQAKTSQHSALPPLIWVKLTYTPTQSRSLQYSIPLLSGIGELYPPLVLSRGVQSA